RSDPDPRARAPPGRAGRTRTACRRARCRRRSAPRQGSRRRLQDAQQPRQCRLVKRRRHSNGPAARQPQLEPVIWSRPCRPHLDDLRERGCIRPPCRTFQRCPPPIQRLRRNPDSACKSDGALAALVPLGQQPAPLLRAPTRLLHAPTTTPPPDTRQLRDWSNGYDDSVLIVLVHRLPLAVADRPPEVTPLVLHPPCPLSDIRFVVEVVQVFRDAVGEPLAIDADVPGCEGVTQEVVCEGVEDQDLLETLSEARWVAQHGAA